MRSNSLPYGTSVARIAGKRARSSAIVSLCSARRRSTIEKNGSTLTSFQPRAAKNSSSCSSMRAESGVGSNGTTSASAACMTFSETSDMLGGQSRIRLAYFACSGRISFNSSVVASCRLSRCTSMRR